MPEGAYEHSHSWNSYTRIVKKGKKEYIQRICTDDGIIFHEVEIKRE